MKTTASMKQGIGCSMSGAASCATTLYGTIEEDVWRRDFTANALYYNIGDFSVWDYVGGVADARDRVLRLIGDPETRYREDPVRMLRAVRFAAKLGFTIHPDTLAPIPKLAWMLDGVPPARLFDEVNKLFLGGFAVSAFAMLGELGLTEHLFPDVATPWPIARQSGAIACCNSGLAGTDERVRADKSVTPTFLFAVLLWPAIRRAYDRVAHAEGAEMHRSAWLRARSVTTRQQARVAIPKRFTLPMREIIGLQPRFERREGRARTAIARASALSRGLRFPVAARSERRSPGRARDMVDRHSGCAAEEERVARVEQRPARQREPRRSRPTPSPPSTSRATRSSVELRCDELAVDACVCRDRRNLDDPVATSQRGIRSSSPNCGEHD